MNGSNKEKSCAVWPGSFEVSARGITWRRERKKRGKREEKRRKKAVGFDGSDRMRGTCRDPVPEAPRIVENRGTI